MLALIAAVLFLIASFESSVGEVSLAVLALAFLAAHFAFDLYPWRSRR